MWPVWLQQLSRDGYSLMLQKIAPFTESIVWNLVILCFGMSTRRQDLTVWPHLKTIEQIWNKNSQPHLVIKLQNLFDIVKDISSAEKLRKNSWRFSCWSLLTEALWLCGLETYTDAISRSYITAVDRANFEQIVKLYRLPRCKGPRSDHLFEPQQPDLHL